VRQSDREWVSVAEEIEFVRSYLEIEQMRFGERLQVRIDVETGAQNIRIPAMVIQTLAENAIKHGIAQVRGLGVITIAAQLVEGSKPSDSKPDALKLGDRMLVQVSDNGPALDRAIDAASLPGSSAGGGYGLKNIQERLSAHYGAAAALRFGRDTADATTVVSFEIPAVTAIPGNG
jgi:sensor histidine kinase YesM